MVSMNSRSWKVDDVGVALVNTYRKMKFELIQPSYIAVQLSSGLWLQGKATRVISPDCTVSGKSGRLLLRHGPHGEVPS